MEKLKLIVAIAGPGLGERMSKALEGAGCAACFHLYGQGTAKAAWMEYLGLTDTRRDVLLAPCAEGKTKDALAALQAALEQLSAGERLLFYRKYYYLPSTAQIALELGLTERAVEGRLYRLKRQLRKLPGGDEGA